MFQRLLACFWNDRAELRVTPKSAISFFAPEYECLGLLDSFRFLQTSIEKLVQNLNKADFI